MDAEAEGGGDCQSPGNGVAYEAVPQRVSADGTGGDPSPSVLVGGSIGGIDLRDTLGRRVGVGRRLRLLLLQVLLPLLQSRGRRLLLGLQGGDLVALGGGAVAGRLRLLLSGIRIRLQSGDTIGRRVLTSSAVGVPSTLLLSRDQGILLN